MRISDWSSDVCSSDLRLSLHHRLSHALPGLCRGAAAGVAVAGLALHPLVPPARAAYHGCDAIAATRVGRAGTRPDDDVGARGRPRAFPTRPRAPSGADRRSEEHTSELQSLMRTSYAVFCLKKKTTQQHM